MAGFVGRVSVRPLLLLFVAASALLPGAPLTYGSSAAPPRAERRAAAPTPSGAGRAYPLNHTFDAAGAPAGTPPANAGFESPSTATGTPPANSDFAAPSTDAGTPPTNYNFESGDLTGWTTTGTVTIQTDVPHGRYARLASSGGSLTSSAVTVDAAAQAFVFDVGYLTTGNYSWVNVYALTGAGYTTETLLAERYCLDCGTWDTIAIDAAPYRGQSVKLKFSQLYGDVGLDNVRAQVVLPQYTTAGTFGRATETGGNAYATLGQGGALTSAAFTVAADAQSASMRVKGISPAPDQYRVTVLSGVGFGTTTELVYDNVDDVWTTVRFDVSPWLGQQVKVQVLRANGSVAVDDLFLQAIDLPQWRVTGATTRVTGGPSGAYARTTGSLTSAAFTVAADEQQVSLSAKSEGSTPFYVELLRGADFSQVVQLDYLTADVSAWKTFKVAVHEYAGETVKLRVRRYLLDALLVDNVGVGEQVVPGWTLLGTNPVAAGEDAGGSYVTPFKGDLRLRSATMQTGIIDRSSATDQRYVAMSYDIGYSSGNLLQVYWYNTAGGNWSVFQDGASSPTGYRTQYFYLADFMGAAGYFVVQLTGGGKLYSIADNLARQQLAEPFSQKVGLRVDTSTGAFGFSGQDLATAGTLPLVLTRYYNGHSDRFGTLGYRWSYSFDTRLAVTGQGDAGVVFGSGREAFFVWSSLNGTFTAADARVHDTLVKNVDGTYTFTTTGNLAYRFTAAGVLSSITDLNGNAITLAYDGGGKLTTATGPGGGALTFAYDGSGRLANVTDPVGAVVRYGYDAAGDLATATDPVGKVESYTYDQHRLTKVVDKNGQTLVTNTLDSVHRVTTQTDAAGTTITLAYDTPAAGATRVTDPNGGAATYYFDAFHRTTDTEDPLGKVRSSTYDANGNLQKVTDPALNQWTLNYDGNGNGNVTSVTDPLNQPLQMTWNAQHQPVTVRDKRGNVTTLVYDAAGNVTQSTDPLGKVSTFTYDARGNRTAATNPLGQTETFTYDAANHRLSRTDALGHTWRWTYDAAGRVLTATDPLNNVETNTYDLLGHLRTRTNALNQTTSFAYDALGALVSVTDPLGNVTSYAYDSRGLNTTKTDPTGKVTTYTWDASRRLSAVTDPLARTTTYAYDAASRLQRVTDPTGAATSYTYGTAGRLATETDPLGRVTSYADDREGKLTSVTAANGGVTVYAYDADGNRTRVTDALGNVTTTDYDALSRPTKVTDPLLRATTSAYDAAGRLTSTTNPLNQTTISTYDAAGRLTAVTNPLGQTTTYGYDAANRRTTVTDPLGRTTTSTYDAAGRTTGITDLAGGASTTTYDAGGRVTRVARPSGAATAFTYDPRGLLLTTTDPLGRVTSSAYDAAGQQTSMTDPRNVVTTYAYDGAGRQTRLTDAAGGAVQFTYDAAGQPTAVTNPRAKTTRFTYDALGNVLTQTDPLGRTTTYAYDLAGRTTSVTDPRGVAVTSSYDAAGQLTATAYPGGSTTYAYDAAGRRTAMTDATGTTTWSYDAAARTTAVAAPQGTVSYAYNAAGQRASMTLPGSRTVGYSYDSGGRLASLTDWGQRTTSFAYDADGRRTTITRPGGVTTTNVYDAAGQLTSVTHANAGGTLRSFTYGYDAAGNRTGVTSAAGTESYTLDVLGRLTAVTYPGGATESYTYDANGNRLTKTAGGSTTTSTYDDADQLLTEGTTTHTYDAAGNLTARGGDTFTWDWRNRLTGATVGGTTTTYAYDGDDVRVRTTTGTPTTYLWDRASGLPLLVDDGANGYLHAGGVQAQLSSGGAARYLLADGLGSVRASTDSTGALAGSADYEVFGAVRGTTTTGSPFGFTGEQTDAETGLSFLRARYLHPASGRFLSADTVQPNGPGTQGYNLYAYVANNPTTWTDPSGHQVAAGAGAMAPALDGAAVLLAACLRTVWCAAALAQTAAAAAPGSPPQQLAAAAGTAFILVACAIDVAVELQDGRAVLGGCFGLALRLQRLGSRLASDGPWAATGDARLTQAEGGATVGTIENSGSIPQSGTTPVTGPTAVPATGGVTAPAPGSPGGSPPPCFSGSWMDLLNLLIDAAFNIGNANFGIKTNPRTADDLARLWLGDGFRVSSNGKAWISQDKLRQYRVPSWKPGQGKTQANFEWRPQPSGRWGPPGGGGNMHLDIDRACP